MQSILAVSDDLRDEEDDLDSCEASSTDEKPGENLWSVISHK